MPSRLPVYYQSANSLMVTHALGCIRYGRYGYMNAIYIRLYDMCMYIFMICVCIYIFIYIHTLM